jgi:starch synthase
LSAAPGWFIFMIASEAVPFAKTGGLADATAGLATALGRLGHRVTLVVPRYRGVASDGLELVHRWSMRLGARVHDLAAYAGPLAEKVRAVLLDCPELYDREGLYGIGSEDYPDNARRFAVLVRAALELAAREEPPPDLVHSHEWQGGLAPLYLRRMEPSAVRFDRTASVFTIHNLAYQGLFPPDTLAELDLGWDLFTPEGIEYWGRVSFLKAGIVFADGLTTVSRRYAREILTSPLGFGFEGILARRRRDLTGIVNGIDTTVWDPERDPWLPQPFSVRDLSGKRVAKRALLVRFGLPADEGALARPLIAMISRMVAQKGLDLLVEIADELPRLGAVFVVLGSGEPRYEQFWRDLAAAYPDRFGVQIGFDEPLAHLIEAGADMFLMPSQFEPCGLNQLYSLRYGTVPIVRATGGLDDTVKPYNRRTGRGTGFKFRAYSGRALLRTLRRALSVFADQAAWRTLQLAGMREDYSWDAAAREYVKVYRRVLGRRRRGEARPRK